MNVLLRKGENCLNPQRRLRKEASLPRLFITGSICTKKILYTKSLTFDLRNGLCVSDKDKEILTIEISRENQKHSTLLL